ncbi:GPI transamidase component [Niveomyces insectorum RCEF 264]|uniref:GPI transamidase component n=1 Tax=Niveomyces insectorum RCEF 264 TaxID=1081102 RepID=A0A167NA22_9HYPO|nr:GPI transamidase component [Niveomyces insectorum RCEF 264]
MTVRTTAGLYVAAAAVRLALCTLFPGLPDLLTGRVEISTPVTSFKRLQEGLFLYNHNVSPYDGGVYHQAPLLLPLFSLLPSAPIFTYLLYIAVDLLSADALYRIAESGEAGASARFTSPRRAKRYLFNPFTIATCLGRSTTVFTTCAVLHAIAKAIAGAPLGAMVALSFAAYLSMYPLLLLPPLLLLAFDRRRPKPLSSGSVATATASSGLRFVVTYVLVVAGCLLALGGMSYGLTSGSDAGGGDGTAAAAASSSWTLFLRSTYGVQLTLSDLTPNVGLWWYFFIEMFDSFRAFFVAVFWLHLASYVGGLTLRLRTQPLVVLALLTGIFAIFKPYPSVGDTALFLALVPLFRHVFPLMRYTFVVAATIMYATCLGPAFYHLWIYAGSGNANFFYAITLVWSLGQSLLVSDLTFAVLRDEWEVERPEMVGKEIRQI